ncbi:MAG: tRNA 2-thiouridine(34) synthase MnmA [Terriglobia bacterium]
MSRRIAIAMSGGVDSSTAAALLLDAGREVVGLSMQLWNQERLPELKAKAGIQSSGHCCSLDDLHDARRVAEYLGFPFYVVNFGEQFEARIVQPFIGDYLQGRTPIPCVECNNVFKFDLLRTRALQIGADKLATGHYARVRYNRASGRHELQKGADSSKDQSYFLFGMTQEQLAQTEFPLGPLTKPAVREIAAARKLPTHEKPESQEICFVPGRAYADFIEAYRSEIARANPAETATLALDDDKLAGEITLRDGTVLGRHRGVHHFTVGQRKGLGVALGRPLYVISIDPEARRVIVGDDAELMHCRVRVRDVNWISMAALKEPRSLSAKIRNKHEAAKGVVSRGSDGSVTMTFDEPQRAITPGQACVFYEDDLVVGGGWIERALA